MAQVLKALKNVKDNFKEDSCESLLYIVTFIPNLAGFSILKDKVWAPLWLLHVPLLTYIYGVGSVMYQVYDAEGPEDYIQSNVSVSLLIFIAQISYWWLKERPLLKSLVSIVSESDKLALNTETSRKKHKKTLRIIKIIVCIFYSCNFTNACLVYWPHRMDITSHYAMRPCVGMEPLTAIPNRQICQAMLLIEEILITVVVLNFQVLLVFFIGHTALMYQMMADDLLNLASPEVYSEEHNNLVKQKLPSLLYRHVLILDAVDKMKTLYSMPIGINFISNAICMSLFFYLPLQAWLSFMPILVYCFLVFFLYCFLGQWLINASEKFERAVYACGWESFNIKEKKAVYVMLHLAQKPVEILAADIIPVNIYTFATTLQAIFKFVTVMKF